MIIPSNLEIEKNWKLHFIDYFSALGVMKILEPKKKEEQLESVEINCSNLKDENLKIYKNIIWGHMLTNPLPRVLKMKK